MSDPARMAAALTAALQPGEWVEFTKMHGAGNDFVVLDGIRAALPPMEAFSERVGDRNFGIGCDQILVVREPQDPASADFRMEIYNRDGSQVEMCGNGIRAFFKYLRDRGHTTQSELRVETLGGVVRPSWAGRDAGVDYIRVDMGQPVLSPAKIPTTLTSAASNENGGPLLDVPLTLEGEGSVIVSCASMGNPHAVVVVDDVDAAPVTELGPLIERHPAFAAGTNVEFIEICSRSLIRQRTWERGVGETLACGSGACAVGVVSMLRGIVEADVRVELRGGTLQIEWAGNAADAASVFMTGPAAEVFTGRIRV